MSRAILLRNDEQDRRRKSFWVYKNVETTLAQVAREERRTLTPGFALESVCRPRRGVAYDTPDSVVSIGLAAHESLANTIRTSLIYLDPRLSNPVDGDDVLRVAAGHDRAQARSRIIFLGRRARTMAAFLSAPRRHCYDLPPVDLSDTSGPEGDAPRLTIINHLDDPGLARAITGRFLDGSDFSIDCFGLDGEEGHNRVRHLSDAEVGDASASVHIHVGAHARDSDRLRICDSWQSSVPVLFFDVCGGAGPAGAPVPVRNEHDVLTCTSCDEACGFLELLLNAPAMRRLLAANGRASARPAADAWRSIALDLAA